MLKIVFTNPYELRNEAEKINQLFKAGLECLHIRKPRYTKRQLRAFISRIDERFYDRIILHSCYSLISEFGLRGIHINRGSRLNWVFMNFMLRYYRSLNPDLAITTTFTNLSDLKDSEEDFSYVLLGPMFNRNYSGNCLYRFHRPDLTKYLSQTNRTVFALGGITADRLQFSTELGFKGIVLQSAIWKSADPVQELIRINQLDTSFKEAI